MVPGMTREARHQNQNSSGYQAVVRGGGRARTGCCFAGLAGHQGINAKGLEDALRGGAVGGGDLEGAQERAGEEQQGDPSGGGSSDPAARSRAEQPARERGAERGGGGPCGCEDGGQGKVVANGGRHACGGGEDSGLEMAAVVVARALARQPGVVRRIVGGDEHGVQVEEVHRLLGVRDVGGVGAEARVDEEEQREDASGEPPRRACSGGG